MGSKGLGGHGGGGGAGGLDLIRKSHVIWVDLDLNPLPPPTKFHGSAHGGRVNLFHLNALEQIA